MISKVLFTDFRDFEHLNRFSSLFTCVFVCLLLSDHNETSGSFQKKGAGQSNGLHTMHPTYIKQGLTIQKVTLQQKILPDSHSVKAGI